MSQRELTLALSLALVKATIFDWEQHENTNINTVELHINWASQYINTYTNEGEDWVVVNIFPVMGGRKVGVE